MTNTEKILYEGGTRPFPDWTLFEVIGSDRETFLQGQLTNDVSHLELHQSQMTSRLDGAGRILSYFYLIKCPDSFLCLVPKILANSTMESLQKYIICEDVTLRPFPQDLHLVMGPISFGLANIISQNSFLIDFFDGPALVLWGEDNLKKLKELDLFEIDTELFEKFRILSGFPNEKTNIAEKTLINDSYLETLTVDYQKGCFLGQETVGKIKSRRGPAFFPVLFVIENLDHCPQNLDHLLGQDFVLNGKKGGKLQNIVREAHKLIFKISLIRDFRIDQLTLTLSFGDESFTGKIKYLPYFKGHGKKEKALELYEYALKIFTQEDQKEKAASLLSSAILLDPKLTDAYEALGVILGKLHQYSQAIETLLKLTQIDPNSLMAHTNLSLLYKEIGDKEKAEIHKDLANSKQVSPIPKSEQFSQNENMFKQVLEIDEWDPLANTSLGEIYFHKGDFMKAKEHLGKAIKGNAKYSKAYLWLGKTLEVLGHKEEATSIFHQGIAVAASLGELGLANQMQSRLSQTTGFEV